MTAGDEAAAAADVIAAKSPTALAVTLESLRRARDLPSLEAALAQEYRVSLHALRSPDFAEGVRAQVIDKDRQPRWQPASLADVSDAEVAAFFDSVGERELELRAGRDERGMSMTTSIAVIGLGHMGLPMAANLIAAGYRVSGFDLAAPRARCRA